MPLTMKEQDELWMEAKNFVRESLDEYLEFRLEGREYLVDQAEELEELVNATQQLQGSNPTQPA